MAKLRTSDRASSSRAFSEGTQDAFICVDLSGAIVAANPAAEALMAGAGETLVGRPFNETRLPERLRRCVRDLVGQARAGAKTIRRAFDIDGCRADDQFFSAEAEVYIGSQARKRCVVVHLHVIGPRTNSTTHDLDRSNRILATMTAAGRAMLDAVDERQLYAEMCRVIVEIGGFPMAWVGLAEFDEACTVRPAASAGNENGYAGLASISWDDGPRGRGPAGSAIRSAEPQVCNDLDAHPLMAPWQNAARERGYRSVMALPLKEGGAVFGALIIYASEPHAFGLQEQTLLIELADNLAFGVVALHDRKARGELEQALHHAAKLEALGAMSGSIVHDFNNLLQVVMSSLHVIQRRNDDIEARNAAIETIQHSCKRASSIAGGLLAFSRKDVSRPETLEFAREAEKWRELIAHSVHAGIKVEFRIPENIWPIHCDPCALEVALINIAVNARDAMPGDGALTVSARNLRATDADYVEIDVTDTGGGIDPAVLNRVFEPFYTTKPVGKGTGLGLSQVFRFAKQSGGEARMTSLPGQGATVTLKLPRGVTMQAAETPFDSPLLPIAAPRRKIGRASGCAAIACELPPSVSRGSDLAR